MTREELEADLESTGRWLVGESKRPTASAVLAFAGVLKAARKQLALMPAVCTSPAHPNYSCTTCHAIGEPGNVYPQETVETIASAIQPLILDIADYGLTEAQEEQVTIAVLDALNALGDIE